MIYCCPWGFSSLDAFLLAVDERKLSEMRITHCIHCIHFSIPLEATRKLTNLFNSKKAVIGFSGEFKFVAELNDLLQHAYFGLRHAKTTTAPFFKL